MRRTPLMLSTLAAVVGAAACMTTVYEPAPAGLPPAPAPMLEPAPEPPVQGEVSFFYDSLTPYGSWVVVASYGRVWVPRVSGWWRPYTEGRWAYTDDGWTWVGTEPWGWAAYHYGRWYWDAEYGWAWVPGTVWAPAWVAWRSGGGHIGWAPLPPAVRWEAGIGFSSGGVDFAAVIAPQHWCFVEERYITAPAIREYVAPPARNVTFVRVTNNITNYTVIDNRVVNNSVDVARVEQATGRPVERLHIVDRDSPAALRGQAVQANEIPMVRRVSPPATGAATSASTSAPAQPAAGAPEGPRVIDRRVARTLPATATTTETANDVNRRHDLEVRELQAHHDRERVRLQEIHHTEQSQAPANVTADQLRARHLAEQQALEAQHQNEAQMLARRYRRELANVNTQRTVAKPTPKPTPKPRREKDGDSGQH